MRAEEGDESVEDLADEAQQAKKAVDDTLDVDTCAPRPPGAALEKAVRQTEEVDTPVDEALGGVPSPADE